VVLTNEVYCPLCENRMLSGRVLVNQKITNLFVCKPCGVGIYDFDPAFNKWRDADSDIPCAVCGYHKVKWFARYLDGFFKAKCPKCKTTMKKDGDVKFGKRGNIIIPEDMEQEKIEPPVEIKIPFSHLAKKFGKDKIHAIKAKITRKKNDAKNA